MPTPSITFSEHFNVDRELLRKYGAYDINIVSDLPLFVDPFLLFNSKKAKYKKLHEDIIRYLKYLKSISSTGLDAAVVKDLYRFGEVKQNWLGYTLFGNDGHGLGQKFAVSLHDSLSKILQGFGEETVTRSTHLEKLTLIKAGVGRDNISDFATNLIKPYLLDYTQRFAKRHIDSSLCQEFRISRARFNYETKSWATEAYYLPKLREDFVLLTPLDLLTHDDTWISYPDMIRQFAHLPEAVPDEVLRGRINLYFKSRLSDEPDAKERREAAAATIAEFPELIDRYIRLREDAGEQASAISRKQAEDIERVFGTQIRKAIADLSKKTTFYDESWSTFEECQRRANIFKDYVELNDGWRLINRNGEKFSKEPEVQLFFGLLWCLTSFDVNREPNNGRGPVDFKVSFGAGDKSLIEFKLASSSSLERNLEHQVAIYEEANRTRQSIKVIICYTARDQSKVAQVFRRLGINSEDESYVVIDARSDNKPSASVAGKGTK